MKKYLIALIIPFLLLLYIYKPYVFGDKEFFTQDYVLQGMPMVSFVKKHKEGIFDYPLWYTDIFCGMPLQASGTNQISFTIQNLLSYIPGFKQVKDFFFGNFTFVLWLGFVFMFFFLRLGYKLSLFASFFGAFAYTFTTHFIGTQHGNRISAFAYLPLMFWGIKTIFDKQYLLGFLLLIAGTGYSLNSYHQQITYYSLLFVGFYILWQFAFEIKEKKLEIKKYLISVGALVGGFLTGLLAFWPIKEYLPYSARGGNAFTPEQKYQWMTNWSFSPKSILDFIFPHFEGFSSSTFIAKYNQELPTYWGNMPFTDYPHYLGIVVVIFALWGLHNIKKNKHVLFLAISGLIFLLLSMGREFPLLYNIFYYTVPYFDKFRAPELLLTIFELIIAILAAFGLERVINSEDKTQEIKMLTYTFIGAAILLVITNLFKDSFKSFMFSLYEASDKSHPQLNEIRFLLFSRDFVRLFLVVGALWGIFKLHISNIINKKIFAISVISLAVIDLLSIDVKLIRPHYPKGTIQKFYKQAKTPLVDFLLKDTTLYRIFPVDKFNETIYGYWGIQTIGGYSAVKTALIQKIIDKGVIYNPPVFSMLNVKYLISARRLDKMYDFLDSVFSYKNQIVYKNNKYLPRAFSPLNYKIVLDEEETLELMSRSDFDPIKEFIFNEKLLPRDEQILSQGLNKLDIHIKKYSPDEIIIEVNGDKGGILALGDVYYPKGWKAYIDNQKVKIYRTNYLIRAIVVPKGKHIVKFVFKPKSFYISFWISFIISVFVLIAIIFYFFKNKELLNE